MEGTEGNGGEIDFAWCKFEGMGVGWSTVLHLTALRGHKDITLQLVVVGADLKARDDNGWTASPCIA